MIALEGVGKRWGATPAVVDLTLHVADGELLVLLGGSGSGKTTTLKMVNRLIDPDVGRVAVGGRDVRDVAPHELRRGIGYCFQQVGLFPHLTVAENVGITPRLLGWPAARIASRVDEMLDLVELDPAEYRGRPPHALSGGQQQRVGVARALAAEPAVLLLDEPFGALDPITRDQVQRAFGALRARLGVTGMFVTHDVAEALVLGDRIAVLRDGALVQVGTPAELVQRPADAYVHDLLATPRQQAERLAAVLAAAGSGEVDRA
jgi:osmoprotectant transport system ATP-binding protein